MVTGSKPDELVDWSEVAGAVGCERWGCEVRAVARVSNGKGGESVYCAEHIAAYVTAIALAAGGVEVGEAARAAHAIAEAAEVSNV